MPVERITLDTNILIYSLDQNIKAKHHFAAQIVQKALTLDCTLTLQSLSEFYNTAMRKKLISPKIVNEQIQDWLELFPIIVAKPTTLTKAIHISQKHHLSFWDSMLLATAHDANITIILTEDLNHGQMIDGIKIINPFVFNNINAIFTW